MDAEKTVFILGAGASASANLPTQAGILKHVFSLDRNSLSNDPQSDDFLSFEINERLQRLLSFYSTFDQYRQELGSFIVSSFSTTDKETEYKIALEQAHLINENSVSERIEKDAVLKKAYNIVKSINVSLEDLFTIFDNVATEREHFRLFSPQNMADIHNKLKMCIIYAMAFAINESHDASDYELFSKYLLNKRLSSSQKEDTLAVVTMNWDDVLERILARQCKEYNSNLSKNQQRVYPDLCFYDYDYKNADKHIPSTHIKAKGHKNIKILKMHGSLAWLECPKCGRIFTDYESEIAYEEFVGAKCPYCILSDNKAAPMLRSLIITPTFMKSLENLNLKNIWHNAFIDISEADHIVFIGYSFPDADFELRCLLKKSVKDSADITVVLTESNDPNYYRLVLNDSRCSDDTVNQILERLSLPEYRYNSFFGKERVKYNYKGFSNFLERLGGQS